MRIRNHLEYDELETCYFDQNTKVLDLEAEPLKKENDILLEFIISQDMVHTAMNTLVSLFDYEKMEQSYVDEYNETLELKAELAKKNDMVEKVVYNELSNRCSRLENWCISLEIKLQQSKESFQNNKPSNNQEAPEFQEFFQINELQAQLKAKNNLISKLKDHIAILKGKRVINFTSDGGSKPHGNKLQTWIDDGYWFEC
ncbi:hypothetical protein Tco_0896090 [Tanacetum coccineum]